MMVSVFMNIHELSQVSKELSKLVGKALSFHLSLINGNNGGMCELKLSCQEKVSEKMSGVIILLNQVVEDNNNMLPIQVEVLSTSCMLQHY